jgi:hypothetical protein
MKAKRVIKLKATSAQKQFNPDKYSLNDESGGFAD